MPRATAQRQQDRLLCFLFFCPLLVASGGLPSFLASRSCQNFGTTALVLPHTPADPVSLFDSVQPAVHRFFGPDAQLTHLDHRLSAPSLLEHRWDSKPVNAPQLAQPSAAGSSAGATSADLSTLDGKGKQASHSRALIPWYPTTTDSAIVSLFPSAFTHETPLSVGMRLDSFVSSALGTLLPCVWSSASTAGTVWSRVSNGGVCIGWLTFTVMDTMSRHGTELVVLVEAFEPRSNLELLGEALAGAAMAAAMIWVAGHALPSSTRLKGQVAVERAAVVEAPNEVTAAEPVKKEMTVEAAKEEVTVEAADEEIEAAEEEVTVDAAKEEVTVEAADEEIEAAEEEVTVDGLSAAADTPPTNHLVVGPAADVVLADITADALPIAPIVLYEQLPKSDCSSVVRGQVAGRSVAVKTMPREQQAATLCELRILLQLPPHAAVVQCISHEQKPAIHQIALSPYCNRSLQQVVEPAGEKAAQMIAPIHISDWQQTAVQQMASGVSHLHRHGVAHQRLSPSTVRVCDSGQLLICSLQHAWCAEFPQSPATTAWAAAADCGREPFKADVFALGALAHYVLTGGAHPFGKRSVRAARISQAKPSLSLLKGTPLAADFVAAAVSHNAADRPSAAICEEHPMLWSAARHAALICEASDQMDAADVACNLETRIEAAARRIFVKDWSGRLEPWMQTDLFSRRGYRSSSARDLLRAVRNKIRHCLTLPAEATIEPTMEGVLGYFVDKYPRLVLEVHQAVQDCSK